MSYLQRPRLHFFGQFETDVSTVNNIPSNYDAATFQRADLDRTADQTLGAWNPSGTGSFRLVGCSIKTAWGRDGAVAGGDPVLAMRLADGGDRVPAKLVDLDPCQQMVSQIWGLRIRIATADGEVALSGLYDVAAFTDLWPRLQIAPLDSTGFSAFYQSELRDVQWEAAHKTSDFLCELHEVAGARSLSIRFVVDHFDDKFESDNFRLGRLCGSLGVAYDEEPKHFVRGRQIFSAGMGKPPGMFPFAPRATFGNAVAVVDPNPQKPKLTIDLSNAVPTQLPDYSIIPMQLALGTGVAPAFVTLATIDCDTAWYAETAGVVEVPLTVAQVATLQEAPLVIVNPQTNPPSILASESPSGDHVRADDFVFRISPGKKQPVRLYTTHFGQPRNATIVCRFDTLFFRNQAGDPPVGVPPGALNLAPPEVLLPAGITTHGNGILDLELVAGDPGNSRVYMDGQVYGVRPLLLTQANGNEPFNPWDFISVLVFNAIEIPEEPTWYIDIRPILRPYANLYPAMRQVLDLDDYESVVAHKDMLKLVFSLDPEDPNYMPVTRDLSPKKRELLLKWLSAAGEPALGYETPLGNVPRPAAGIAGPGAPPAAAPAAGTTLVHDGSKADFLSHTSQFETS